MKKGWVAIKATKLLIVDGDFGGYLAGHCLYCSKFGWLDGLKHRRYCPVPKALARKK